MVRRLVASSFILFCAFSPSAWAEKITVPLLPDTEIFPNVLDPAVQAAVIAGAQFDWRETPGSDVWWVWLDDSKLQVKVFSSLQRSGVGQPQCCLHFTVGGTDFWLKVDRVRPGRAQQGPPGDDNTAPDPSGSAEILPGISPDNLPQVSPAPFPDHIVAEPLTDTSEDFNAPARPPENDVLVPEPSSVLLVVSGLLAVIRKRRLASLPIR